MKPKNETTKELLDDFTAGTFSVGLPEGLLSDDTLEVMERVEDWKMKYFAQHRRMPRHSLVQKRLKHERARGR